MEKLCLHIYVLDLIFFPIHLRCVFVGVEGEGQYRPWKVVWDWTQFESFVTIAHEAQSHDLLLT
jgi:hypothetical protein